MAKPWPPPPHPRRGAPSQRQASPDPSGPLSRLSRDPLTSLAPPPPLRRPELAAQLRCPPLSLQHPLIRVPVGAKGFNANTSASMFRPLKEIIKEKLVLSHRPRGIHLVGLGLNSTSFECVEYSNVLWSCEHWNVLWCVMYCIRVKIIFNCLLHMMFTPALFLSLPHGAPRLQGLPRSQRCPRLIACMSCWLSELDVACCEFVVSVSWYVIYVLINMS
jgi:hypothetical protein